MKTAIDTVRAINYAVVKHMQGYTLLRNAKGTNPREINMIKEQVLHSKYEDNLFFVDRIKTSFNNGQKESVLKELSVTHFFDTENKKMSDKKEIYYDVYKNDELIKSNYRNDITEAEEQNRKLPEWDSVLDKIEFERQQRTNDIMANAYMGKTRKPSLLLRIITLGMFERITEGYPLPEKYPSFIKTLYKNLTNKA